VKVTGITMVKDEADVIEGVIRHMSTQVDSIYVYDHMSTDGTWDILDRLGFDFGFVNVFSMRHSEPGYYQSKMMTELADFAWANGADWIVPFDADELWNATSGYTTVRKALAPLPGFVRRVEVPLFNHYSTALDSDEPDPFVRMRWRSREPGLLPKVAFRPEDGMRVEQGNHGVYLPSFDIAPYPGWKTDSPLMIDHFPYRSAEQMVRKTRNGSAAYAAAEDLPADMGAHWRAHGQLLAQGGEGLIADVFREHYWYLSPTDSGLIDRPAHYLGGAR
jgi:hypothetical protein